MKAIVKNAGGAHGRTFVRLRVVLFIVVLVSAGSIPSAATPLWRVGGGYFGHSISHPGMTVHLERKLALAERSATSLRISIGGYRHHRNHTGLFAETVYTLRRSFASGVFLEQSLGLGILETAVVGSVYRVADDGTIETGSRWNNPDFAPSIEVGVGLATDRGHLYWLRPRIFWQYPQKLVSVYHVALSVGVSVPVSVPHVGASR